MYCTATQFAVSDSSTAISRLNTGRVSLDGRWSSTLLTGSRLSMEFDIVELGNVNGRLRLSMEFDIVDNGLALKEFVWTRPRTVGRWGSTLLTGNLLRDDN